MRTEELVPPRVAYYIRGASWGSTEELTLPMRVKDSWQPDQPSNYPDLEPEHYPLHLRSAEACEGAGPADSKIQDLHDTEQQKDVQEESQ